MTLREFSPEVMAELREIWNYIGQDNPAAADRLMEEIVQTCSRLALNPFMGHTRTDLTDRAVRFWLVYGRYFIVYRVVDDMVDVVRIIHGARDLGSQL